MIIGAHVMLHSKDRDADIAFFRDILKMPNVDAGGGYMLFGVPSSEVAIHAEGDGDANKLYLMCDDVGAFIKEMEARGIPVTPVKDQGWGSLTDVTLPGGGALSVYQPHHPRPATGGKGKGGKRKGGKNKAAKAAGAKGGERKGKKAKKAGGGPSPERQARREERKKARAERIAGSKEKRGERKEQRKAKRAEKKAARGSSTGGSAAGETSTASNAATDKKSS